MSDSTCGNDEAVTYLDFSCNQPHADPPTPGAQQPDRAFSRKFFDSGKLVMPDGVEVEHWGFEDENGTRTLPSPLIRVREGELVHVTLDASKGPHTIHHHGIEPEAFNDGVGHTSFETGHYTYQWRPYRFDDPRAPDPGVGKAGTYFYHCHVNTTLHVQMGLFGGLIVDPVAGEHHAYHDGPTYELERFWVTVGIDPTWRRLSHAAGLCGDDAGLNDFNPVYFLVNNRPDSGRTDSLTLSDDTVRIANASVGSPILVRLLNANYFPALVDFGSLPAEVIASDGTPLPRNPATGARWRVPLAGRKLPLSPAERYDVLVTPDAKGTYPVRWDYRHWISGESVTDRYLGRPLQTEIHVA